MSRVSALFDLQQTDLKIDNDNSRIASLKLALEDSSTVETARQNVKEAEAALVAARSRLKDLEATAQQQEHHANDLEKKLYGGQIKGNKEMVAAQHEIETFRQRKKETDDQSVESMVEVEEFEQNLKKAKENLAAIEAEWQRATAAYREELGNVEAELAPLQTERAKRVKMVMPPDLALYEKLRQQKQGVAVSEVLYGKICSRCRVELPLAKQREIKGGMTVVPCPSCGRILYHKF
ncbi:MAG TPA: C4-type zinc ribbon domain-containing protein [Chloroflexia bacterium]|nr:C4-type zinc ribbon domain-containing protein [Chloroflexia bacterium]